MPRDQHLPLFSFMQLFDKTELYISCQNSAIVCKIHLSGFGQNNSVIKILTYIVTKQNSQIDFRIPDQKSGIQVHLHSHPGSVHSSELQ